MASLFGGGGEQVRAPAYRPPPAPPSPDSPDPDTSEETRRKMEEAARAERKQRGRASTQLTGGAGLLEDGEQKTAKKTLLGDS